MSDKFNPEMFYKDFKNKTKEEKIEFIKHLIHEGAAEAKAAFYNPSTGETIELGKIVESLGEEKTLELIEKAFDSGQEVKALEVSKEDVNAILEKKLRGEEITSEEELKIQLFKKAMDQENPMQMQSHLLEMIIEMTGFAQKNIQYNPELSDYLTPLIIFSLINMSRNPELSTSKFNGDDTVLHELALQVGDDIYNTWKNSCTTEVDDELVILGLLQVADKLCHKKRISIIDAKEIASDLGYEDDYEDSEIENENGSNEPSNVVSFDSQMRNKLKE